MLMCAHRPLSHHAHCVYVLPKPTRCMHACTATRTVFTDNCRVPVPRFGARAAVDTGACCTCTGQQYAFEYSLAGGVIM